MATKLDKNFGLGNSYKNVKLVKSAVRKVDAEVEEELSDKVTTEQMNTAIALAVAGKLPVYEFEYSDVIAERNFQAPCILILTSGIAKYINLCIKKDDNDELMYIYLNSNYNSEPSFGNGFNGTITEDLTFEGFEEYNNVFDIPTLGFVEDNKGTKLYYKRILDSTNNIQIRLFLLNTAEFSLGIQPIIQCAFGYAGNSKHYIFKSANPTNAQCTITLYCIEDATEVSYIYTNSDLID